MRATRHPLIRPILCLAIIFAGIGPLAATSPARAANNITSVLNQAPSHTQIIILVRNLKTLSDHLAQWKQATHVPAPPLDNLLATVKRQLHVRAGLNDRGAMMLIIPDIRTAFADPQTPAVGLLVPVSNYNAFLGNFPTTASHGVTTLQLPGRRPDFVKQVGRYALISQDQKMVSHYTPAHRARAMLKSAGAFARHELSKADVGLYVNLQAISPAVVPMIDQALAQMKARLPNLEQHMDNQGAQSAQQSAAIAKIYGQAVKAVIKQATALVSTIRFKPQGVAMTDVLQAKPNTELARLFPGGSGRITKGLMRKLPNASYLFASAYDLKAIDMPRLIHLVLQGMPQHSPLKPIIQLVQQESIPTMQELQGSASMVLVPSQQAMMGGGLVRAITVNQARNGKAYIAKNKARLKALNGKKIVLVPAHHHQPAEQISISSSYTDNAIKVDGKPVDMYHLQIGLPANLPQSFSPVMMLLGGTGYNGYIVAEGNDVLNTTSLDRGLIKQGLTAIKQNKGLGTRVEIQSLRRQLPPHLVMESYFSLAGAAHIANLFLPMLPMFHLSTITVPKHLPPIASGMGIEHHAIAYRLFVPNQATAFVVNLGTQFLPRHSGGRLPHARPGTGTPGAPD